MTEENTIEYFPEDDNLQGKVNINYDKMRSTANRFSQIASDMRNTARNIEIICNSVGHPAVAAALQDFNSNWDVRRTRFAEKMTEISDDCLRIVAEFHAADQHLSYNNLGMTPGELLG
jgi:hypothetical protein